jgi:hypothetical protein
VIGSRYSQRTKNKLEKLKQAVADGKLSLEEALERAKRLRHEDLKRHRKPL